MPPLPPGSTLNNFRRYEDIYKINQENKHILRRLQRAKSVYNSKLCEQDFKRSNYLVKIISENSGRYSRHPYFNPHSSFNDPNNPHTLKSNSNERLYDNEAFIHKRPSVNKIPKKRKILRMKKKEKSRVNIVGFHKSFGEDNKDSNHISSGNNTFIAKSLG